MLTIFLAVLLTSRTVEADERWLESMVDDPVLILLDDEHG